MRTHRVQGFLAAVGIMALVVSGLVETAPSALATTASVSETSSTSTPASSSAAVRGADAVAAKVTQAAVDRWSAASKLATQVQQIRGVKASSDPTVVSPAKSGKAALVTQLAPTVNNPYRGTGTASISGTVLVAGSPTGPDASGVLVTAYVQNSWNGWVAYTTADPTTGAFTLSNLPALSYTLQFRPYSDYRSPTTYAWEWLGGTYTQNRATAFTVADGQAVIGMDITLPVASSVSATIHIIGAPPVHAAQVWRWYLVPDTGINTAYSISGGQGDLNGGQDYTVNLGGLPAGEYKICAYIDSQFSGGYPYGYLSGACSPGHADSGGADYGGPYFTVPASTGVAIDVGSMQWPTVQGELDGGSNPSEGFCECNRADPVDTMTGTFTEDATDLALSGVGPAASVARHYSSADAATQTQFGHGWQSPLSLRLVNPTGTLDENTQPQLVNFVQENGAIDGFFQDYSDGHYAAASRIHATLSWDAVALQWTVVRKNSTTFHFDATGVLLSEADADGNTVTFGHDASNAITSITGSGNRSIALGYTNGLITSATDSAGRTVSYGYDASGNLTSVTDPTGATTTYGYSLTSQLTTITRPRGGVTTNTYDSSNRITTQVDPMNRSTTFNYTSVPNGQKTIVTTPDGSQVADFYTSNVLMSVSRDTGSYAPKTTSYSYDSALDVASVTDPLGNVTTNTYDSNANLLTKTDPLGKTTTNTYDISNNELTTTDPLGRQTIFTYSPSNHPLTKTLPSGAKQVWTYNADGTVATATSARGNVTQFGYDTSGRQTTIADPDGRVMTRGYNSAGFLSSSKDPAGATTTMVDDANGHLLTATDPNGQSTTYTYDSDGNQVTVKGPAGTVTTSTWNVAGERTAVKDPLGNTTTWVHAPDGQVASVTDPLGHATTSAYNGLGLLASVTDADNHITSYGYDGNGHQLTVTLPTGKTGITAYDAAGQINSSTDPVGNITTYAHDAAGQETSATDPLGRITGYAYTPDGLPTIQTLAGGKTTSRSYDADGDLATITNADGKVTTYTYDNANLMIGSTLPGNLATSYSYDAAGRKQTVTAPNGTAATSTYDSDGRPTRIHSSVTGTTDVTYTYDALGRRTGMTDATGIAKYTYDTDGRLTAETNGAGTTIGYGYDAASRNTTIVYPGSHTVTYGYDNANLTTSVKDWANHTTTFTYTADSKVAKQTSPNGIAQTNAYDSDDRPTLMTAASSSTTVAKYTYGYDSAGEMTSDKTVDPSTSSSGVAHTYTYDTLSQLASATTSGTTSTYTATAAGVLAKLPAGTLATNTAQQLTKLTPTSGNATTYTYDSNGDRSGSTIGTSTTAYTWAANGSLASVTLPGAGGTVTNTSDGDGLRQTRKLGTTTTKYTWSHLANLSMLLDDGTNSYIYGPAGQIIEQIIDSSQTVQYLFHDLLGSVRLITSSTGATAATYTYDTYGKQTGHTGTSTSGLGYTGNLTDASTGLLYLRARDYDPSTAQFLSVDPAVDLTRQPYTYVANNPLLLVDPLGLAGGSVGTIAGWIAVAAGLGGLALDATVFGAPIGVLLEVISLGAGAVAIADDCAGVFGGDRDALVCGLDIAGEATAGIAEIPAAAARAAEQAAKAAAKTGIKEYTAAAKAAKAAALNASVRGLRTSSVGLGTAALNSYYGQQLVNSIGGSSAESSVIC